jgi:predicted PurR-regulated permease PerM
VQRIGAVSWRLLAAAALIYVTAELADELTLVVVSVAVATLLTGVLEPLVRRVHQDGWPNWIVPLGVVLIVLIVIVASFLLLGARVTEQLPELRGQMSGAVDRLERSLSLELDGIPWIGATGEDALPSAQATDALKLGIDALFGLFLTLSLTFLLLKDGRTMWRWILDRLPTRFQEDIATSGEAAWSTVGTYVRGLTMVALFDAVGVGLGLWILGVPLVLTLAAVQFVASYVPTIGAFVAGGLAAVVALGSNGLATAAMTVLLVVVVQQLGNNVMEPWIMGRSLPLHPAVILMTVTAGALLWGIPGALLAVPLVAAGTAAAHELRVRHRSGPEFRDHTDRKVTDRA